jgi:protein phosphatase
MLSYSFKLADRVGGRTEQQDAAGAVVTRYGLLVLVCDGMGGARGGSTASRMAVELIQRELQQATDPDGAEALADAIRFANREIYQRSQHDDSLRGMGTTLTALLLQPTHATLAHAGDSRIYQFRRGKVIFRTTDHSKVFELVKRGILSEEQARLSEESNVILRALGIKPDVDVELHDHQPYQQGDRFLLCTDGISGAVPEETLLSWLESTEPVETLAARLVREVDEYGFRHGGGHDNLTAAVVECRSAAGEAGSRVVSNASLKTWGLPLLLLLTLGALALEWFVKNPQIREKQQVLAKENQALKRQRDALRQERDSLRQLLTDPLVRAAARQASRKRELPDSPAPKSGLAPSPKPPKALSPLPPDSAGRPRRPTRPGALVSPGKVRATDAS